MDKLVKSGLYCQACYVPGSYVPSSENQDLIIDEFRSEIVLDGIESMDFHGKTINIFGKYTRAWCPACRISYEPLWIVENMKNEKEK